MSIIKMFSYVTSYFYLFVSNHNSIRILLLSHKMTSHQSCVYHVRFDVDATTGYPGLDITIVRQYNTSNSSYKNRVIVYKWKIQNTISYSHSKLLWKEFLTKLYHEIPSLIMTRCLYRGTKYTVHGVNFVSICGFCLFEIPC